MADGLEQLLNLGPQSARWLRETGITTREQVAELGPVAIYAMLRAEGYNVSLNLVYALEGALRGVPWNRLPDDVRDDLKARVRALPKG